MGLLTSIIFETILFIISTISANKYQMWNDQPIKRAPPPVDMPPSTRAFLSPFNRSFTPPALINDPYAVDRKLVITPLLLGSRSLRVPRNPFAVDPAVERVRHYVGCEKFADPDLCPSPLLAAVSDIDWVSDEETCTTENDSETIQSEINPSEMNTFKDNGPMITKIAKEIPDNCDKSTKFCDVENHLKKCVSTTCDSSKAPYNTQESNWFFVPAECDLESDTDCQKKLKCPIPKTEATSFEEFFRMTASSRTQSEGTAITSWDEWDEASDMLSHFDPIAATGENIKIYDSLL